MRMKADSEKPGSKKPAAPPSKAKAADTKKGFMAMSAMANRKKK